jgi:hypothetical protein
MGWWRRLHIRWIGPARTALSHPRRRGVCRLRVRFPSPFAAPGNFKRNNARVQAPAPARVQ